MSRLSDTISVYFTLGLAMIRAAVFAVLCTIATVCLAEPVWQFVRVSGNFDGEPTWKSVSGSAKIHIDGEHIKIEAFDILGPNEPSLIIEGKMDRSGRISATGTRTHSDENPFALKGTMLSWNEDQVWGSREKIVTYHEIVFPLRPHYEFYGFLSREVSDKVAQPGSQPDAAR